MEFFVRSSIRPPAKTLPRCEYCRIVSQKGIKNVWPDGHAYRTNYVETSGTSADKLENMLNMFNHLGINRTDGILDIGANRNILVEGLQKEGYTNSIGIDYGPSILMSKYGRQMNFRDMPLDMTYKVIHFCSVLDFFPGGVFNNGKMPSLDLFALKLYLHLEPKGYVFFKEATRNFPEFEDSLSKTGFIPVFDDKFYPRVWQKA